MDLLDLLDKNRSIIHTGRLLRQPDGGLEWVGELFVLFLVSYGECSSSFSPVLAFLTIALQSCDDQSQREGWNNQILCQPPFNTISISSPLSTSPADPLNEVVNDTTQLTHPHLSTSSNSTGASGLSSSTSTSGAGTSAIPI
ncbi:hypothetical protein F5890DRAFT_489929 [Lentinula detonsa]|uniref:Uncharacterized protein n=1 Tax=Lentinula detonsa TaxID=2804962 RepID=A0AA38PTZ0_9AGAR|nr:hypothetical protein F5890DRAFT_489929 [Lentinula detonsa]